MPVRVTLVDLIAPLSRLESCQSIHDPPASRFWRWWPAVRSRKIPYLTAALLVLSRYPGPPVSRSRLGPAFNLELDMTDRKARKGQQSASTSHFLHHL